MPNIGVPEGSTSSKILGTDRRLEVKNGMKPAVSSSESFASSAVNPIDCIEIGVSLGIEPH